MVEYIPRDHRYSFVSKQCALAIDATDLLIIDIVFFTEGGNIVDPEWQNILVVDCVNDSISVQSVSKGLLCSAQGWISAAAGIGGENWSAGETEDMVILEGFSNLGVHFAKLRAMAFIEDNDGVLIINVMRLVFLDKDP